MAPDTSCNVSPEHPLHRWVTSNIPRGKEYDARFEALAQRGEYLHGEADFIMDLHPKSLLDAGCGTGRIAIELASRGIEVVGVDLDPEMVAVASSKGSTVEFRIDNCTTLDLERTFTVVLLAGNVVLFVAQDQEAALITRCAAHVASGGYLVAGYALGGDGIELATYDLFAEHAGLTRVARYSTWDREPWHVGDRYVVCVDRRLPGGP